MEVLGLHRCTTCQRVVEELRAQGVPLRTFRDLREQPLTERELAGILERVGGAEELFSRRALKYRQLGLHQKVLSPREMTDWMLKEPTFIARPVVLATNSRAALCGAGAAALRRFVEGLAAP